MSTGRPPRARAPGNRGLSASTQASTRAHRSRLLLCPRLTEAASEALPLCRVNPQRLSGSAADRHIDSLQTNHQFQAGLATESGRHAMHTLGSEEAGERVSNATRPAGSQPRRRPRTTRSWTHHPSHLHRPIGLAHTCVEYSSTSDLRREGTSRFQRPSQPKPNATGNCRRRATVALIHSSPRFLAVWLRYQAQEFVSPTSDSVYRGTLTLVSRPPSAHDSAFGVRGPVHSYSRLALPLRGTACS